MELSDIFTHHYIHDVLKSVPLYSDKSEISFSLNQCQSNNKFTVLKVKSNGLDNQYVLVTVPEVLETDDKQPVVNTKVLYPAFYLKGNDKQFYGAFEYQQNIEQLGPPTSNDVECLKIILQHLAEHQALDLASNKESVISSEYNIKDICDTVTSLDSFVNLDRALIKKATEKLQIEFNALLKDVNLLVSTIACPFAKNVFLNKKINSSTIFATFPTKKVPPAYDALLFIFALSDEKFRQTYFETLLHHYFESLHASLQRLQSELAEKITRRYSEHQVKVLLSVVKFKRVGSLLKLKCYDRFEENVSNISHFLKYPLINQEDIYEAVKNKLQSSDFDLLDYSLVCLSESNGHLGEYFHLNISVKFQETKQQFQLFAKILNIFTDFQKEILEGGPAKKEDFFYKTLIPLYAKHGLESLTDFGPKCYLSRIHWLVILDDLSQDGYVAVKPNSVVNYEGLKAIVIKLANFHACSILLEEILSKKSGEIVKLDQEYGEYLKENTLIYEDGHVLKPLYDSNLKACCYVVEKFPEVTERLNLSSEEIRERLEKAYLDVFSKVKISRKIRKVINHGDMYIANMLFKFGKEKLITEGLLIDFQLLRYATPCLDLLFFLHASSTKDTRDKYLKTLIDDYYNCIIETIKKFNFDPEIVFPKEPFDEDIKYMTLVAVMWAFAYAYIIQVDPELRESIFHDAETSEYYLNKEHITELVDLSWGSEYYRNILKGLVEDMVDLI